MSDDEELLNRGNDLYKYLVGQGFYDFSTFKSNKSNQLGLCPNNESVATKGMSTIENKTAEFTPISLYDYNKIINILNSKLLFIEDVELIEFMLSNCHVSNHSSNYCLLSGIVGSLVSLALYFKKGFKSLFPLGLASLCFSYSVWWYNKKINETRKNKKLAHHIKLLQNLCCNIHKLLRFLKETEILSTGQVTTYNVCAAMYIPTTNLEGLDDIPSWKTLPHLRQCLADALIDSINTLSVASDSMKQVVPDWMNIRGYTLSNDILLQKTRNLVENLRNFKGCISIRDLQLLNDSYLLVQSECLKWVAFSLCPVLNSSGVYKKCIHKNEVLKLFEDVQSKLSCTSCKLKIQYDIQKIFSGRHTKEISQHKSLVSHYEEIKDLQVEIHNILLVVLSIVMQINNLEDYLENSDDTDSDISTLRKKYTQKLSIVRDDLLSLTKKYDEIYYQAVFKKNSGTYTPIDNNVVGKPNNISDFTQSEPLGTEKTTGVESYFNINSPDEVFLALSGMNTEEHQTCRDDWSIERKPQIPKTLLTELSTTLKPIKKGFKKREKLALERAGLKDIKNDFDSENEEKSDNESSEETYSKDFVRKSVSNSSISNSNMMQFGTCMTSAHHIDLMPGVNIKSSNENMMPSESIEGACSPVFSNSSLANIIAMKSKTWGNFSEECYSND